jgi:soluble lytic murein transglycosylase-like protein
MKKRRQMSVGKFLVIVNLAWYAICTLLLAGNAWQYRVRKEQERAIATMNRELRGQRWEVDRARALRPELQELQFMAKATLGHDPALYQAARAAWKWGKARKISPYLIMAVAHRESDFDPRARSYVPLRDAAGNQVLDETGAPVKAPLAYGIMQINLGAHPEVDPSRIYDVDYNVEQGTRILKECIERNDGDVGGALFNYWGGDADRHGYGYPGRVLESKYFDVHPVGAVIK